MAAWAKNEQKMDDIGLSRLSSTFDVKMQGVTNQLLYNVI